MSATAGTERAVASHQRVHSCCKSLFFLVLHPLHGPIKIEIWGGGKLLWNLLSCSELLRAWNFFFFLIPVTSGELILEKSSWKGN